VVAVLAAILGGLVLLTSKPAHDDPVVRIFLSADESEAFSVDSGGTVKRWSLPSGAYRGQGRHAALARAARIEAGPRGELLAFLPEAISLFSDLRDASPVAVFSQATDAALAPGGLLVLAEHTGLAWRSLQDPGSVLRRLSWPRGARYLAVSREGVVSFLDRSNTVVTVRGNPPQVVCSVPLASACDRLLYTPSGSFLLVLDSSRRSFGLLGKDASEVEEGPEGFDPDHLGFIGPDTLVTGEASLRRIELSRRDGRPYWSEGAGATALTASPRHSLSVFGAGREIYLVGPPAPGSRERGLGPGTVVSRRLRHRRFSGWTDWR
jgi:hypothetical protein